MDCKSILMRLRESFRPKSALEQYIESKNPKTGGDIDHWLRQWTYSNHKDYLGL